MSGWVLLAFAVAVIVLARLGKGMLRPDPDRWRGNLLRWVLELLAFMTALAVLLHGAIRFVWLARRP
jgi:hypothetical protein